MKVVSAVSFLCQDMGDRGERDVSVLLSSFPKMDVEMLVPELWWKIFSYMSQVVSRDDAVAN